MLLSLGWNRRSAENNISHYIAARSKRTQGRIKASIRAIPALTFFPRRYLIAALQ